MRKIPIITGLLLGIALQAQAAVPGSEYWQRDAALAAVNSISFEQAVREAGDIATLSDAASTLDRLRVLEARPDWPLPALWNGDICQSICSQCRCQRSSSIWLPMYEERVH